MPVSGIVWVVGIELERGIRSATGFGALINILVRALVLAMMLPMPTAEIWANGRGARQHSAVRGAQRSG